MQKNNSTVKKQSKNVSRNALQIIIQELSLPDFQKVKMYEDLRNMGITDDNDPLVKFTMIQGLFAKYTGEKVGELVKTSEYLEDTMLANEGIADRFSNDLQKFQKSIKVWNNEVIIKTQGIIDSLQNDEKKLHDKIKKEQEELYSLKREYDQIKTSCTAVPIIIGLVCILSIFITVIIHAIVWESGSGEDSKTVECRETVEKCKPTLKVADKRSKRDREYEQLIEELKAINLEPIPNTVCLGTKSDIEAEQRRNFYLNRRRNEENLKKSQKIFKKIIELDKKEP